jgi:hypothetical protein
MAAKAIVLVEAVPCINGFRGHGPLTRRFNHGRWMNHEL